MKEHFIKKIKIQGPISISEYMTDNNIAPIQGYYNLDNTIGKSGDFITSPEISQVFGELIGLYHTNYWHLCENPKNPLFIELGGGNGTMMKDALRAISKVDKNLRNIINPIFIETSINLKKKQKENVPEAIIYEDLQKIPNHFIQLTANEFFDALPIKQFIKINDKWHERLIDIDPNNNEKLRFIASKNPTKYIKFFPKISNKIKIFEFCPSAISLIIDISNKIKSHGGIAIIIDYSLNTNDHYGSLQAVKKHKYINPLDNPGFIDLSARVNFDILKKTALQNNMNVYGPIRQNKFLKNLGIDMRFKQLIKNNPNIKKEINASYEKLMSENEMGRLFKVMIITKKSSPVPDGFSNV